MKGLAPALLFVALFAVGGCLAQEESPPASITPSSEQELSSEVEEVIGITEETTIPAELATSEILTPEFEVNATIDLGSVI